MATERITRNLSIAGTAVHRLRPGDVVLDQHGINWAVVSVESDASGYTVRFAELFEGEQRICVYSSRNTLAVNGRVTARQAARFGIAVP